MVNLVLIVGSILVISVIAAWAVDRLWQKLK